LKKSTYFLTKALKMGEVLNSTFLQRK